MSAAGPLAAYYHIVSDADVPHVKHLYPFRGVEEFLRDLETFQRKFRFISLHDLLESLRLSRQLPSNSILLTFDDGFREVHDVIAPILLKKGIPATFFIITGCLDNRGMAHHNKISLLIEHLESRGTRAPDREILAILSGCGITAESVRRALLSIDYEKRDVIEEIAELLGYDFQNYLSETKPYLTSEQIRKLIKLGFTIGAHTIDHPCCSRLEIDQQLEQTRGSVLELRKRFSLNYGAFAFPHGDDKVLDHCFDEMFADSVDVSFGTGGILKNSRPGHIHRFSTENSGQPASQVLGRYYARSVCKRIKG